MTSNSNISLLKILYREILQTAKSFDVNPALKFTVTNFPKPPIISAMTDAQNRLVVKLENESMEESKITQVKSEFLRGARFYWPSQSLVEIIRRRFRDKIDGGPDAAVDIAFAALKAMNKHISEANTLYNLNIDLESSSNNNNNNSNSIKKSIPPSVGNSKEKDNKKNIKAPNITIDVPLRPGVFLLSHPLTTSLFRRSIVLIGTNDPYKGSDGLIINKLVKVKGQSLTVGQNYFGSNSIPKVFSNNVLRIGGPVGFEGPDPASFFLHRMKEARTVHTFDIRLGETPKKSARGKRLEQDEEKDVIYRGGDISLMAQKTQKPEDVFVFRGFSRWFPGQLEREVKMGRWKVFQSDISIFSYDIEKIYDIVLNSLQGEYAASSVLCPIDSLDDEWVETELSQKSDQEMSPEKKKNEK